MADKVVVISPDTGKPVEVEPGQVKDYLSGGYVLDSPELQAKRAEQEKYGEGLGNEAKAFGAAALRAPTLGLSDLALEGMGADKEGLLKRQEYNPDADTAGTVAGLGAGLLVPGVGEEEGAGLAAGAAKAASVPMRAVAGVGEGIGKGASAITKKLLAGVPGEGIAGTIAEHAPGVIGGAADTAAQAALYNAANQVDENHLAGGNLQQGIENALATTGDALKLGAGLHIAGAVGGKLALAGAQKAVDGLGDLLRNKVLPAVGGVAGDGFAKASSALTGEPIENLEKYSGGMFQPGSEGADARQGLTDIKPAPTNAELAEQRDVLAKELYEKLDTTLKQTKEMAFKGAKDGDLSGIVPAERAKLLDGASSQAAVDEAQRLGEHLRQTAEQLASDPVTYAPNIAKKAMQLSRDYDEKLAHTSYGALLGEKTTAPLDLYNLIEDTKDQLAKRSKFGMVASTTEQDALTMFKQAGREFRKSLENPEVWGDQAARQASLNRAVSDHLTLMGKKGAFRKDFMMEKASRGGSSEWVLDRTKVNTFLNKLGAARGERQLDALNQFLENAQELVDQTRESGKSVGVDLSHYKYVDSLLETAKSQQANAPMDALGQAQHGISANHAIIRKGIEQQGEQAKMRALANGPFVTGVDPQAGQMKMPGALSTGIPGMVTAPIRGAVKALKNPLATLQTLAKVESFVDKTSRKIQSGITRALAKTGEFGERIGSGARAGIAEEEAQHIKSPKEYQKQLSKLVAAQTAPDMGDRFHKAMQGEDMMPVAEHAPNFAKGVADKQAAIAKFLFDSFPKDPSVNVGVGGGKFSLYRPSDAELDEYYRKEELATHPTAALEKIAAGTLMTEDVDILKKLWPEVLKQMQDAATKRLSDTRHEPSWKQLDQMSVLLGHPVDDAQTPELVQLVQKQYADAQAKQKKAAPAQANKAEDKLAMDLRTSSQKLLSQ